MITITQLTSSSNPTAVTILFECAGCQRRHSFNFREKDDTAFVTYMNEMVMEHAKCNSRLTEET